MTLPDRTARENLGEQLFSVSTLDSFKELAVWIRLAYLLRRKARNYLTREEV